MMTILTASRRRNDGGVLTRFISIGTTADLQPRCRHSDLDFVEYELENVTLAELFFLALKIKTTCSDVGQFVFFFT